MATIAGLRRTNMRTPNNLLRRRHVIYCAEGFTSALDFAVEGVVRDFPHPFSFGSEKTDQRTDAQSLRGDWIAVGQDIQTAIGRMEQEVSGGVAAKQ